MKYAILSGVFLMCGLNSAAADSLVERETNKSTVPAQAILEAYAPPLLPNKVLVAKFKQAREEYLFKNTCLGVLNQDSVMSLASILALIHEAVQTVAQREQHPETRDDLTQHMQKKIPKIRGLVLGHDANALRLLALCCGPCSYTVAWSGQ